MHLWTPPDDHYDFDGDLAGGWRDCMPCSGSVRRRRYAACGPEEPIGSWISWESFLAAWKSGAHCLGVVSLTTNLFFCFESLYNSSTPQRSICLFMCLFNYLFIKLLFECMIFVLGWHILNVDPATTFRLQLEALPEGFQNRYLTAAEVAALRRMAGGLDARMDTWRITAT